MDTSFLSNPINTAITAITVILVVIMVIYLAIKRNLSYSKTGGFSISNPGAIYAEMIPHIDIKCKNKLRMSLLNNVDAIYGKLAALPNNVQQRMLLCTLDELNQRIELNSFTKVMSDKKTLSAWLGARKTTIMSKARIFMQCSDYDPEEHNIDEVITDILNYVINEFAGHVYDACQEKLAVYNRYKSKVTGTERLITKNEAYLEILKEIKNA